MPLKPPNVKKYVKASRNKKLTSHCGAELTIVTHQCKTLVLAGTEIITVIVLYNVLVVFANPTMYM